MTSRNHRLFALSFLFPLAMACGGVSDSGPSGTTSTGPGGDPISGGETSDFGDGTGGALPEGDYCNVELVDSLGGAGGAFDCSRLEVPSSGCPVVAYANTDTSSTGGGINTSWDLTEGTYLLGAVVVSGSIVSEGEGPVGVEFEGTLVITESGPSEFRVESDLKGPTGHLVELSTWYFDEGIVSPTKHCGDPETFLGYPLSDFLPRIYGDGPDGFTYPHYDGQDLFNFRFMRAGTGVAPRHPL